MKTTILFVLVDIFLVVSYALAYIIMLAKRFFSPRKP
jgi:hypothetical protein